MQLGVEQPPHENIFGPRDLQPRAIYQKGPIGYTKKGGLLVLTIS